MMCCFIFTREGGAGIRVGSNISLIQLIYGSRCGGHCLGSYERSGKVIFTDLQIFLQLFP